MGSPGGDGVPSHTTRSHAHTGSTDAPVGEIPRQKQICNRSVRLVWSVSFSAGARRGLLAVTNLACKAGSGALIRRIEPRSSADAAMPSPEATGARSCARPVGAACPLAKSPVTAGLSTGPTGAVWP
eukprot:scaffold134123_cov32-Tisochrysis_lutea.AAC.3